jgi:Fe-Mn family superoxide dismutase
MNTKQYTAKTFDIPELKGISKKNIEEHLKLYAGYVKHANLIREQIGILMADVEKNTYTIGELQRRFGFEFNGMRNHELYFNSLSKGPEALKEGSSLGSALSKQFGSYEAWLSQFKTLAMTRGIGWAMLYYDHEQQEFVHAFIEEQHLGQLINLTPVLALDMWEHAYVYDFATSEKKKYIESFFENLNWAVIEENFSKAVSRNI